MLTIFNGYSYFVYNRNISKNTLQLKLQFCPIFLEFSNKCKLFQFQIQLFYYFLFSFEEKFFSYEDPFRSVKYPITGASGRVWMVFDF